MTNGWKWLVALLSGLLLAFVVLGNLGGYALLHEEPRRALIALELLFGDTPWQPTIHGDPYFRKPPLYNWVIASFYWLFQSTNEWVTRLPSAFSLIGLGICTYWFTRKYLGRGIAGFAFVILICFPEFMVYYGRLAEMDIFFALLTFPVIVLPWVYLKSGRSLLFFTVPPFIASIGFLAKGFPSVGFLGVSMLCAIFIHKRPKLILHPGVLLSFICFLLPLLIYFVPIYQNGLWEAYLQELTHESFGRVINKGFFERIKVFFELPLQMALVTLPFFVLAFTVKKSFFSLPVFKAVVVLFFANLLPYLISPGARLRYIYPLLPLLAIILGFALNELKEGKWIVWFQKPLYVLIGIGSLGLIGLLIYFGLFPMFMVISVALVVVLFIISFKLKTNKISLLLLVFLLVSIARLGHDAVGSSYEVQREIVNYQEKWQAQEFVERFGDRNIYFNPGAERYFSFSYEVTRLTERVMKRDLEFKDSTGLYIIRPSELPKKMTMLEPMVIGNDSNFILAAYVEGEEQVQ